MPQPDKPGVKLRTSIADAARVARSVPRWISGAQNINESSASASTHLVREASVEDAAAIAHVYFETARAQYAEIVARRVLQRLAAAHLAARWELLLTKRRWVRSTYIAEDADGRVVGFAAAGPTRVASLGPAGELYAIYVLPQWQRLGLGRMLFYRAVQSLASAGVDAIVTWVFAANPSRSFFESLGGTPVASASSPSGLRKVAYAYRMIVDAVERPFRKRCDSDDACGPRRDRCRSCEPFRIE